ncbi:MAG: tetratricopeptide repeat protein [Thermonemataceae bacterium]
MRILIVCLCFLYTFNACSQQKSIANEENTDTINDDVLLKDSVRLSPGKLYEQAKRAYEEGYYSKAVHLCDQVISLDSSFTAAFYTRALIKDDMGNLEEAIRDYTIVIQRNPKHSVAYVNRGGGYMVLGNYSAGLKDMDKAIEINPNTKVGYFNRGNIYELFGESEKACADWQKAADLGHQKAAIEVEKNCK